MSLQYQSLALFYYVLLGFPVSSRRQLRLRSDARERNATSFVDKHDDELLLYLIALQFGTTSNESFVHSRYRKVFYQMLSMSERRREETTASLEFRFWIHQKAPGESYMNQKMINL